jgi:hypothetical protein
LASIGCVGAGLLFAACSDDGEDDTTGSGASGASGSATGAAGATGGEGSGAVGGGGSGAQGGGGAGAAGGAGSAAGGAGGTVNASGTRQCTDSDQCVNPNDCCTCEAFGPGEPIPDCNLPECVQTKCSEMGEPNATAACIVGQCVAGFQCEHAEVLCAVPTPVCPPGMTATLVEGCWGECVLASECFRVSSCVQCGPDHACVTEDTPIGLKTHCVPVAPSCNGDPSCACMGAAVCLEPFDTCTDVGDTIACSCSTC